MLDGFQIKTIAGHSKALPFFMVVISLAGPRENNEWLLGPEAEYRSLAYTIAELIWIKQMMSKLHSPLLSSRLLLCDNIGAIFMTKNPVIRTRSKHIALDFHIIKEQVEAKELQISPVFSVDKVVDIFTKPLHKDRLTTLRHKLQIRPDFELVGGNKGTFYV